MKNRTVPKNAQLQPDAPAGFQQFVFVGEGPLFEGKNIVAGAINADGGHKQERSRGCT